MMVTRSKFIFSYLIDLNTEEAYHFIYTPITDYIFYETKID